MRKKILVVVYNLERAREHEWFVSSMDPSKYEFHFALVRKPDSHLGRFLEAHQVKVHRMGYSGKSSIPALVFQLYRLIKSEKYDIVHTHLFESSLCGMLAAWLAGVPQRIVTRHHSDYHHVNSRLAVWCDRLINRLSTTIVAISKNVKNILVDWEGCDPKKVVLIPHGIELSSFGPEAVSDMRVSKIRREYDIPGGVFVVGVVSRFIDWKGLQFVIPAFRDFNRQFPRSLLVLANAQGPYEDSVNDLLESLPPESFRKITFEEDMGALYRAFDCFVHVPVSPTAEAFGQTYIEAMASQVPMVITISGIAHDFAKDGVNCLVVPHQDSTSITRALIKLHESGFDTEPMVKQAYELVCNDYGHLSKYKALDELYSR